MASRVTVKIGGGKGPKVRLDSVARWSWELQQVGTGKVTFEAHDADGQLYSGEVTTNDRLEGMAAVRVNAIEVPFAFIATLVRESDAIPSD